MSKKNLVINAAVCDARNVNEDTLASYENIIVNAATIITTPKSRAMIHNYNVTMNCADVLEVPDDRDIEMMVHNGKYTINASDIGDKRAILIVNGSLTIEPGAETAVSRFVSIYVNGSVTYPGSMASILGMLKVNGSTNSYPDDAILLKRTFIVDKTFIKRCKSSKYFAKKRIVLVDPLLDVSEMVNKGVSFITGTAIVAESLLEVSLPMFSDETELVTVPDDCKFVNNDAELSNPLLMKYGTKLYINGDMTIGLKAESLLKKLEYLRVNGDIRLPKSLEEVFCNINAEYENLLIVRDKCITDKVSLSIDNHMLEQNPGGITVIDCVMVKISKDVSPELLLERLELHDCVNITCFPEQRSALEQIAKDVVNIDDSGKGLGGMVGRFIPNISGTEDMKDVKMINSANYKF